MKHMLLALLMTCSGTVSAQYPWYGYELYDWLVSANHPQGCDPDYVTLQPDDSTWVNMLDFSVMTGYFGQAWNDQPGDDLLLETSFHRDNYEVRLILASGGYSNTVPVNLSDWIQIENVAWHHMFPGCVGGTANFEHFLFPLNFGDFGVGLFDDIIGIEITFLPTPGYPDFAGAYIIIPPCGMFDLGPDTTICPGATVDIDATTPNATYEWQDGSTDPVFTSAGPGKYWVEVTLPSCSIVDTIDVYESSIPLDLGDDVVLCDEETLLLNAATPGGSYEWQDNSSQSTFTVSEPGTYWVHVQLEDCVYGDTIEVDYHEPLAIHLGNDTLLCGGENLLLDASYPGATYVWQDNSTTSDYTVNEPGTYAVTITVDECDAEDMLEVEYFFMDPVDLGGDVQLCEGETLFLDAFMPGATYLWQDNSTNSGFNVTAPGIYGVVVSLSVCTAGDTIEVTYGTGFDIDLGDDVNLCAGESITLDATTPGATYTWQDNTTTPTYTVTAPGEYIVVVETGNCTASDTVVVNFGNTISLDLGNDTTLCSSQTIVLDAASPNASYVWQDNSTNPSFNVTGPGTYYVQVQIGNCYERDTIIVAYANPTVNLGNDTTLCEGASILLDAFVPGAMYVWQDYSTDTTFLAGQPGTYTVAIQIQGCIATDEIEIAYLALDALLGNDTTLCAGQSILLDAQNAGATYVWDDHSTASTLSVNQPGQYSVTISLANCSISDSIQVAYDPLVPFSLGKDTSLCEGEMVLLTANAGAATITWQDNTIGNNFLVTTPGTYWATATSSVCSVADTITVNFVSLASVNLGNDTTLCEGNSLVLEANAPGAMYVWSDHSTTTTFTVTEPGTFWLQVSAGNCSVADTIAVDYTAIAPVDLGNDTTLCNGSVMLLNAATPGAVYQWSDNSANPSLLVLQPGSFAVTVTVGDCKVSDTIDIAYLTLPAVSLGNDTTLCTGAMLVLDATSPGSTYEWQDGSDQPGYIVHEEGQYSVEVRQQHCTITDTIYVSYLNIESIDLGYDTTLCWGDTLTLLADVPGAQYLWSDNSTAQHIDVVLPGAYWVHVSLASCTASDSIEVEFSDPVFIDLGDDLNLCEGEIVLLDATTTGAMYSWHDNSTHATYTIIEAGNFWVAVDVDGCVGRDTITALYTVLPEYILGNDTTLCQGDIMVLDATYPGANYLWQDNTVDPTFTVGQAGAYKVKLQVGDCITADSIQIQYAMQPDFDLGADTTICAGTSLLLNPGISAHVEYVWQDNSSSKTYTATEAGLYWLRISDHCSVVTDSISIETEDCNCHIYVPNIFTPGGDGINDILHPVSDCAVTAFVMRVYDRFGGLLFESKDESKGWDGTANGKIVQVGVYAYVLSYQFPGEELKIIAGDLTVIR